MNRTILMAALTALTVGGTNALFAQEPDGDPPTRQNHSITREKLSGPRFGFTVFTGEVADRRQQAGLEPIMTQFGWQLETKIASSGENQALMEWVFLIGGVEQDELNGSVAWLTGYRMPNGFEIGAGPGVSINKNSQRPNTSMIVAAGATLPFGELHLPLHTAVSLAKGGPRITTLIGWIVN